MLNQYISTRTINKIRKLDKSVKIQILVDFFSKLDIKTIDAAYLFLYLIANCKSCCEHLKECPTCFEQLKTSYEKILQQIETLKTTKNPLRR